MFSTPILLLPKNFINRLAFLKNIPLPTKRIALPNAEMTWLHQLNPTPSFPAYTGRFKVGTVDVEVPVEELDAPSPEPEEVKGRIETVAFRVFYPCQEGSKEKFVRWIPEPQREYVGAYARFLGANGAFAQFFS